jgi:hypothetical protein
MRIFTILLCGDAGTVGGNMLGQDDSSVVVYGDSLG